MEKHRIRDAHAVILPAFDTITLSDSVKRFLGDGGCSILLGESREEYVSRTMSDRRLSEEAADAFLGVTKQARDLAGGVIVAVDQEIGGICRLHGLVPGFPDVKELKGYDTGFCEDIFSSIAAAARNLGVNCFLGPILDVVTGRNPWLSGRTWSMDPAEIARVSSAYIRGIQASGVAATAKHFPGFHNIALDPAIEPEARVIETTDSFKPGFIPFTNAVEAGVEMIMVGPCIVEAFDPENPASISPKIIGMLRNEFDFRGVVMSDDLDARATLRDCTLEQTAVHALKAGSDFLLIAAIDDHLERVVGAILQAVEKGDLAEDRLAEAGSRVRMLAQKYGI